MYLLPAFCSFSKLLVVMFELFLGGVVKHSKRAIALQVCIYDKSLIVTVESDTMETSLVHCLEHCYSCCALVTIRGNELVIFHGIALYSDDKYIISFRYMYMYTTYSVNDKLHDWCLHGLLKSSSFLVIL